MDSGSTGAIACLVHVVCSDETMAPMGVFFLCNMETGRWSRDSRIHGSHS